ncbi:MAG: alpha-glucan family phosphorylase [Patescibacteria group bacterium]
MKNFNYKITAFDLDGTLAESKQPITPEMFKLLNRLLEKTKVAIISGGSFALFKEQFLSSWEGPKENLILLPVEGSQCYEFDTTAQDWKRVYTTEFSQETKDKAIKALNQLVTSGKYDIPSADHAYGHFVEDRGTQVTLSALGQEAPLEVKRTWDPDQKKRLEMKRELEAIVPEVEIAVAGMTSLDVLPKGLNKAVGLQRLLKQMGWNMSDMIFAGDSVFPGGNDYSPLEAGIMTVRVKNPADTARFIERLLEGRGAVAYFCAEYGIPGLPIYAGGLGMLSEDFVREAGDKGMDLHAIGLFYNQRGDSQSEDLVAQNARMLSEHQFELMKNEKGDPLVIDIDLAHRIFSVQVWRRIHGSSSLYLLDADLPKNSLEDRKMLSFLYKHDIETSIIQQLILGIGGVKLLRTLKIVPDIYHMNEGHTSFVALALVAEYMHDHPEEQDLHKAAEAVRQITVASKHTILSVAGINFTKEKLQETVSHYFERHRINFDEFFALGVRPENPEVFSTTRFMLQSAVRANGVSLLHTQFEKIRHPHSTLIPITNGVYLPRWRAASWPAYNAGSLEDAALWELRNQSRKELVDYIAKEHATKLDPQALTIVWARRFASYKRPSLLFSDLERLAKIVAIQGKPVQFIISGKAHDSDPEGLATVQKIKEFAVSEHFHAKVIYISDYSVDIARKLVKGADVWLNTPIPGFEACGTSGMKASLNGALQCSTPDGWVGEVDWTGRGFTLIEEKMPGGLYDVIEKEIVPEFFDRDTDGVPKAWIKRVRATLNIVEKEYTASRMVDDYYNKLYFPK